MTNTRTAALPTGAQLSAKVRDALATIGAAVELGAPGAAAASERQRLPVRVQCAGEEGCGAGLAGDAVPG